MFMFSLSPREKEAYQLDFLAHKTLFQLQSGDAPLDGLLAVSKFLAKQAT